HFLNILANYYNISIIWPLLTNRKVKTIKKCINSDQNKESYVHLKFHLNLTNGPPAPSSFQDVAPRSLHFVEIIFSGYLKNKRDLVIKAPTPTYFNWTCEQVGLRNPYLS
ncbi:unnamed protein product, partial [Meganyctiphanes norvegica]